ncbi:hypothetical protein CDD83_6467 [Cordyceps sp. RAO-2017]|nr:hypothetical protein CDD83_6467 [Cordyceps sp. RAO-2017]
MPRPRYTTTGRSTAAPSTLAQSASSAAGDAGRPTDRFDRPEPQGPSSLVHADDDRPLARQPALSACSGPRYEGRCTSYCRLRMSDVK